MIKKNLKHLLSKGAAIVLSAALAVTSLTGLNFATASAAEGLTTFETVSADKIAEVMSPGWNLGNQLEANSPSKKDGKWYNYPGETKWGNPVITKGMFKAVKEAGFKSVRIPISYLDYIADEASEYKVDEAWMVRIKEVVDMALAEDLYVVINMHGDGYNSIQNGWLLCNAPADQQPAIQAKYKAVWKQIATMFADYDEHLIFESMNEEFDGVTYDLSLIEKEYYENINTYNQIFVDTVRQAGGNNAARWLIVCGWNTNIEATVNSAYGFAMPTDTYKKTDITDSRIMVSVHYYEPWGFCGGEDGNTTQWGSFTTNSTTAASTFENAMASAFNKLRDTFTSKGIPVFIGEYGAIDKSDYDKDSISYCAYFDQKVCENSKRIGAIPMYWDNGHNGKFGFGIFDRTKASDTENAVVTQPEIIKAIMNVYAESEKSDSTTKIVLDKTTATANKDENIQLTATLTPADATDTITWSSSDETVAVVSQKGEVKVLDSGECEIIATLPNGEKASCKVSGAESGLACKWYASNTKSWSVSTSDTLYIKDGEAGTYTATLTMSKESMCNIGAIYLKDMNIEAGIYEISPISYCHISVNSVKVNGVSIPLVQNVDVDAINDNFAVDMLLINQWNAEKEMIANMPTLSGVPGEPNSSRTFEGYPGVTLSDTNTIEIEFETLANPNASTPGDSSDDTPSEENPSDLPSVEPVTKVTVKKVVYEVSDASKKTASVVGVSSKKVTGVTIASTVKIDGITYKVTSIGKNAFKDCAMLKKITVKSTKLTSVKANALKGINAKCKVYVPKAKFAKYKKLFKNKGQKNTVKIVKK